MDPQNVVRKQHKNFIPLPNGAQIYLAHNRKILVVVSPDFCSDNVRAGEICWTKSRAEHSWKYMVKFWLFCRDVGIFLKIQQAQLFWKIHQDFQEHGRQHKKSP